MSPPDEAIWWLSSSDRDNWPVIVTAINLPSGNSRGDDKRQLIYWSKSFYDSVAASLAAIGRALPTQAPPGDAQVAPDVLPLLFSLGRAGDVRTAIQLALANPGKPLPAPAPAPAPPPPSSTVPVVPAPTLPTPTVPTAAVPAPSSTPAPAPATQVTPASAANAIVQSGNVAPPVTPDQAMQYSATTAITPPSSTLRWVLLGVLALGGIGGGTYYFIKKRKAAKAHV